MWVQVKSAPNLMMAEMWKEFFEGEGIPARLLEEPGGSGSKELSVYRVMVSEERVHVVREVLKKL